MTEKRSDYRKRQSRKKKKAVFDQIKAAFSDQKEETDGIDVNPAFKRDSDTSHFLNENKESNSKQPAEGAKLSSEDKSLRLKKRLNSAILIVFVLIILVLIALFHL